jgi:hypothetical protein
VFRTSFTVTASIFGKKKTGDSVLFSCPGCTSTFGRDKAIQVEFKKISERSIVIGMVPYLSSLGPVDHSPAESVSRQWGSKDLFRTFGRSCTTYSAIFRVLTCWMTFPPKRSREANVDNFAPSPPSGPGGWKVGGGGARDKVSMPRHAKPSEALSYFRGSWHRPKPAHPGFMILFLFFSFSLP